jgi:hypothetical protein
MLSATRIQQLQNEIDRYDDERLVAESRRLLAAARPQLDNKLLAKWEKSVEEAAAVLETKRRFRRAGSKEEARGQLRGFCLNWRKHYGA